MKALLVVDVQNDFTPGGALPAEQGHAVISVINALMAQFPLVVASRDWHPQDTVHFERWPVHCVKFSAGAEYDPLLDKEKIDQEFLKGTDPETDSGYSAFEATSEDLDKYLREHDVDELYVVGLTTEYCVKATVLDAVNLGYKTFVVTDAVAAVNMLDAAAALEDMRRHNASLVGSQAVLAQ
ncbi:MAG: isochorismatase family protein [Bradymonadaceae bacterium]|nr:isochorismatase family protein [Lujinxingiaceae bacterium]